MVEVRPSLRRPVKNFALGRLDVRYGLIAERVQEPVRDLRLTSAGAANLIGKPTEESPHDLGERHTAEMLGGTPGRCSRVSHFRNARVPTRRVIAFEQFLRRCHIVRRNKK